MQRIRKVLLPLLCIFLSFAEPFDFVESSMSLGEVCQKNNLSKIKKSNLIENNF